MAKYELKLQARNLRAQGLSLNAISETLGIPKSSASSWTKDIILSIEQISQLKKSELMGKELGRMRSALAQKQRKLSSIQEFQQLGIKQISRLTSSEFLMAGLALYWAEGAKIRDRFEFCNSDPKMIQFIALWLEKCFGVKKEELICRVGINVAHMHRDSLVKQYWSEILSLPLNQFRQTSFKKVKNSKVYENFENHFGTLDLYVSKSTLLHRKVMGLIVGLSMAG